MPETITLHARNVNTEIKKKARIAALIIEKPWGQWISEAFALKLEHDARKKGVKHDITDR